MSVAKHAVMMCLCIYGAERDKVCWSVDRKKLVNGLISEMKSLTPLAFSRDVHEAECLGNVRGHEEGAPCNLTYRQAALLYHNNWMVKKMT